MTTMTLERARAFVAQVTFTYASSVPDAPHSYLVRDKLAPALQADFDAMVDLIREVGYRARFGGAEYVYLELGDGFRYWESRSLFQPGSNLNRARAEQPVQLGLM
jgi:hypothetical protein